MEYRDELNCEFESEKILVMLKTHEQMSVCRTIPTKVSASCSDIVGQKSNDIFVRSTSPIKMLMSYLLLTTNSILL